MSTLIRLIYGVAALFCAYKICEFLGAPGAWIVLFVTFLQLSKQ